MITLRMARVLWNKVYLNEYCRLSRAKLEDIDRWIFARSRLREDVPGEREWCWV